MPNTPNLHWLKRFVANLGDRRAFILSFVLGFIIRLIPELLSYPNPIGFDTVYYAVRIKSGVVWSSWKGVFSMWLFEGILVSVNKVAQMDPILLLKLSAPLLYGLNVCGIYHFSRKSLNWSVKTALMGAFFFAFQLASLRTSWDLYRNLLGSGVLLFTLPLVTRVESKKNFVLLPILSLLLVLSHILVAGVLFAVVLATLVGNWLNHRRFESIKLVIAISPAFIILFMSFFVFPPAPYTPGGLFFFVNYLSGSEAPQSYATYLELVSHTFSLFSLLYLWWLPLIIAGFFRDRSLDVWTLLLLFGSFNALIFPFFAVDIWSRWMFLLVYPFTFYAANGFSKVLESQNKTISLCAKCMTPIRISRKKALGILSSAVVLGSLFMATPPFYDRFGFFTIPTVNPYFPSSMLYNSLPLRDVDSTIQVLKWLNEQMNESSALLTHYAFFWWAKLYLDDERVIISFVKNIDKAVDTASGQGYKFLYTIWWNEDLLWWQNESIGWYGFTLPTYFVTVFRMDRISAYKYSTLHAGESA